MAVGRFRSSSCAWQRIRVELSKISNAAAPLAWASPSSPNSTSSHRSEQENQEEGMRRVWNLAPPPPIHHLPPDALRLPLRDAVVCRPVSRLFHETLTSPFMALVPTLRLLLLRHPRPEGGGCLHAFDSDRRCWLRLPFTSFFSVASSGSLLYLWIDTATPPAPPSLPSYAPSEGSGKWMKHPLPLPSKPRSPILVARRALRRPHPWRSQWKLYSCPLAALTGEWAPVKRAAWADVFDILKRPRLLAGAAGRLVLMIGGLRKPRRNLPTVLLSSIFAKFCDHKMSQVHTAFQEFQHRRDGLIKALNANLDTILEEAKKIGKETPYDKRKCLWGLEDKSWELRDAEYPSSEAPPQPQPLPPFEEGMSLREWIRIVADFSYAWLATFSAYLSSSFSLEERKEFLKKIHTLPLMRDVVILEENNTAGGLNPDAEKLAVPDGESSKQEVVGKSE